jgi:hypothetical protein
LREAAARWRSARDQHSCCRNKATGQACYRLTSACKELLIWPFANSRSLGS